jgi:hypothetical protein
LDQLEERAAAAIPKTTGILKSNGTVTFSPDDPVHPCLEIGESNVFVDEKKYGELIFPFLRRDQFKIELLDGTYKFSTEISDENENVIAQIIQNVWKFKPSGGGWDMNHNSDAIEVKDGHGDIVLQVRVLPDRVQFQGIWWTSNSELFPQKTRIAVYEMPQYSIDHTGPKLGLKYTGSMAKIDKVRPGAEAVKLPPLFKYPSEQFLGELAD